MNADDLIRAPRRLETSRLVLESPCIAHAEAFNESLKASASSLGFIGWGRHAGDLDWARDFCARGAAFVAKGEDLIFHVFLREGGAHVGRIDLHSYDFDAPRCEIGYVGDLRFRGQGLMREAVQAVLDLGFALGLVRIHAHCDALNTRSISFIKSLGFVQEGVMRFYARNPQGELNDEVVLAFYNAPRS
nr:GNAT family N-acetyltransferase [uncultured Roseateles sp.]